MDNNRDEIKAWRCSQGHVLGQVRRNGSKVRQLMLYREAVDMAVDEAAITEVDVIAIVEGYVADVRCSLCGCLRTWVPGEESLRRLMGREKGRLE